MANLNFTVEGSQITVTIGTTGIMGVGFKRDKFNTDGATTAFTLTQTPTEDSLFVFWNGVLQEYGVDYTISGKVVTLSSAFETGKLEAMYAYGQYATAVKGYNKFAGDGSTVLFALSATRIAGSLFVFVDGIMKELNVDYTETGSGASITFTSAPYNGAVIEARYDKNP